MIEVTQNPKTTLTRILLSKEMAKIPSLKNAKLPGKSFLNPKVTKYLKQLTAEYYLVARNKINPYGGSVFALIILGKSRVDADNAAATICDWLEPSTKIVGQRTKRYRGWGVGLVANDSQITSLAIRAKDIGIDTKDSEIILTPMAQANKLITDLIISILENK